MGKKMEVEDYEEEEDPSFSDEAQIAADATEAENHRDMGADEFDDNPAGALDSDDDRVRGAGRQSLDELTITRGEGWGLDENGGGLRADRPDQTVNDAYEEEDEPSDRRSA